jgi:protein-S-isoprenylcysteine O-methyltransferase Ste14
MYLGELLFLLGLAITTFSLLSVVVWAAFFVFLDRMATFEEKELTRIMGQQYVDYRKRVRKWIPF